MNENIETMEKDFILYWRHGDLTHVKGTTIDSAFTQAGYGAGAMGALDFYMEEKEPGYVYNKATHSWDKKENLKYIFGRTSLDWKFQKTSDVVEKKLGCHSWHNSPIGLRFNIKPLYMDLDEAKSDAGKMNQADSEHNYEVFQLIE